MWDGKTFDEIGRVRGLEIQNLLWITADKFEAPKDLWYLLKSVKLGPKHWGATVVEHSFKWGINNLKQEKRFTPFFQKKKSLLE